MSPDRSGQVKGRSTAPCVLVTQLVSANSNGAYVTVGGDTARLLQALILGRLTSRLYRKHVRIVALKPNKDLACINELFEAGRLVPVIDGPYKLADLPEAFRLFGTGDHQGKIIVTMT